MTIFRRSATIEPAANSLTTIGDFPNGLNAGKIKLNGTFVSSITGEVSFTERGYASSVSIISGGVDMSDDQITITGTSNGNRVSETIFGPIPPGLIPPPAVGSTVTTNTIFDTVESIHLLSNAVFAGGFTIGSNRNVAVVLNDSNSRMADRHPNYVFDALYNSLEADAEWAVGESVIYGVVHRKPNLLTVSKLDSAAATRDKTFFPLTDITDVVSVDELHEGVRAQFIDYPYSAIIVYFTNGVQSHTTIVEIAQS